MGKALKRWWPLFMLPTCLAFMIGFVIPFIQGFYLSFCQFIIISNAHFVGIENYVRALSDPQFSTSFFFTVAFAFLSTVLINVIALAIAQALTRKALKGTNIFRTIFFMPNLIGGIVLTAFVVDATRVSADGARLKQATDAAAQAVAMEAARMLTTLLPTRMVPSRRSGRSSRRVTRLAPLWPSLARCLSR